METIKAIDGSGTVLNVDTYDFDDFIFSHTETLGTSKLYLDRPNQLHQLIVTVSKHIKVLKSGRLKRQQSAIHPNLKPVNNPEHSNRVVHFLIRDAFTGYYHAEISTLESVLDVVKFLYRSWSGYKENKFRGLPDYLMVTKGALSCFPEIAQVAEKLDIPMGFPASGFQSGVRCVRDFEDELMHLCNWTLRDKDYDFDIAAHIAREIPLCKTPNRENFIGAAMMNLKNNLPVDDYSERDIMLPPGRTEDEFCAHVGWGFDEDN